MWLPKSRCHNPASSLWSPGSNDELTSVSGGERQTDNNYRLTDDRISVFKETFVELFN